MSGPAVEDEGVTTPRAVHHRVSGHFATLCGVTTTDAWELVPYGQAVTITCDTCRAAADYAPQDMVVRQLLEPAPTSAGESFITGDDDPARGRRHRSEHLQLCLTCGELRGPYGDRSNGAFDNLCDCDRQAWDQAELPRAGDLSSTVRLCRSCVTTLIGGSSRWSPFHCDQCMPAVQLWRRMAGRSIVPIGPHSIMNGIGLSAKNGRPITSAQATAFSDQLNALFTAQTSLHELAARRALEAARELGFAGHAVLASDFIGARRLAGGTAESGFAELVAAYTGIDARELSEHIWRRTTAKRGFDPQSIVVRKDQ